jgi:cold shock CspA family protein
MELVGVVTKFDEARGDGLITGDTGELFYFHCVALRDGSRHVDVGTRVSAQRSVGHLGEDEATDITVHST